MLNEKNETIPWSAAAHAEIRSRERSKEDHAFVVDSDGAGFSDGYAGAAVVVLSSQYEIADFRIAAFSGSTTERAEFEAFLMGLQAIDELLFSQLGKARWRALPIITVWWENDRESLILGVARNPKTKEPYNRRRSSPDLWARFAFYEERFEITPVFIPRETDSRLHHVTDFRASEIRNVMLDYGLHALPEIEAALREHLPEMTIPVDMGQGIKKAQIRMREQHGSVLAENELSKYLGKL